MNKDQVKDRTNEARGKEKEMPEKTETQGKEKRQGSKDGAVLADINEDAKENRK